MLSSLSKKRKGVGRIEVSGTNKKCIDDAMRMIKAIVAVPEVGEVYKGKGSFYHALRCVHRIFAG